MYIYIYIYIYIYAYMPRYKPELSSKPTRLNQRWKVASG